MPSSSSPYSIFMSILPPGELAYQEAHIRDNKGPIIIGVSIMLLVLSTTAVGLRVVARRMRELPLAADDYLIFLAQVGSSPKE